MKKLKFMAVLMGVAMSFAGAFASPENYFNPTAYRPSHCSDDPKMTDQSNCSVSNGGPQCTVLSGSESAFTFSCGIALNEPIQP